MKPTRDHVFQQIDRKKGWFAFDARPIEESWSTFKGIFHTTVKEAIILRSKEKAKIQLLKSV
jgi:hypothetical protein